MKKWLVVIMTVIMVFYYGIDMKPAMADTDYNTEMYNKTMDWMYENKISYGPDYFIVMGLNWTEYQKDKNDIRDFEDQTVKDEYIEGIKFGFSETTEYLYEDINPEITKFYDDGELRIFIVEWMIEEVDCVIVLGVY